VKRKAFVVIIILLLILGLGGCKEESKSKNLASKNLIKQYDWEQNAKVPKNEKKLLSKVVENGEVIKKLNYNEQGQLISKREKKDDGTIRQVKYFYNPKNKLKKKKIKEKSREEYNEILVTNKYNDQGKLVKQNKYLLPDGEEEKKRIGGKEKEYDEDGRVIYKKVVDERKNINKEWNYKYNKYDKLIFKQIKSHGKVKLLKEYTNEQEPKILTEKEIKNGKIYRFDEYKYNSQDEVVKKIDKSDPDKEYIDIYSYNEEGLLKSVKQWVKNEVKHIEEYYYDSKEKLVGKKILNKYVDSKQIIKYEANKTKVKGFEDGELDLIKKLKYDEKDRLIRMYKNNMDYDKKSLREYKYNIKGDVEWKGEFNDEIKWWYELDFNRKDKVIKITKKNKQGKKLCSTYFKYTDSSKIINCKIIHFISNDEEHEETLLIEEIDPGEEKFNWYEDGREGFSNFTAYFGERKILNSDGCFYDQAGNKLYDYYTEDNKQKKYYYIYK